MPFGRSFYPKCLAATWLHTFEAGIAPAGVEPLTLTALVLCYYESQSALLQSLLTVGFTLREEKCCSSQLWVKAEVLKSLLLKQKNTWDAVIIVNRFNIVKKKLKTSPELHRSDGESSAPSCCSEPDARNQEIKPPVGLFRTRRAAELNDWRSRNNHSRCRASTRTCDVCVCAKQNQHSWASVPERLVSRLSSDPDAAVWLTAHLSRCELLRPP